MTEKPYKVKVNVSLDENVIANLFSFDIKFYSFVAISSFKILIV
ncbi:hypothetical protein K413DRAFT_4684 [Clostridium sp. ASBs410]|nr:hypothetical protein K413DRAFT_4684 [Clostridium sp. ASBs410]